LIFPFITEELLLAFSTGELYDGFRRLLDGTVRSLILLVSSKHVPPTALIYLCTGSANRS
jgi:hypothetical protein